MIAGLKPYPEMEDSGVEWLGEVPTHWEVRRLGTLGVFSKGRGIAKTDITETGVPAITYGDIYTRYGIETKELRKYTSPEVAANAQKIMSGDLLFTASGESVEEIGKTTLYSGDVIGYAGGDVIILRLEKNNGLYLSYALNSDLGIRQKSAFGRGDIIVHISATKLKQIVIPIPPLPEQAAIVRFLNHADRRIRRYIQAKQKLIGLLEEQKQAIIHRAVTRGLDPDVRLKDSGVEWLGEVPAHWEVKRAKYFYREVDERSTTGDEELMSVSHKTGVTPRKKNVTMFLAESNVGHKICRPGDLAINTMWAFMAALGVARQLGVVSPSYGVYRLHDPNQFTPDYIDCLLRTKGYKVEYLCRSTGITSSRLRLYPEAFLKIPILCPSLSEQIAIVRFFEDATKTLNTAIDRAQSEIELLREYRTRLIADVVTGKLDIREAAAQLPDEADELEPPEEDVLNDLAEAMDADLDAITDNEAA